MQEIFGANSITKVLQLRNKLQNFQKNDPSIDDYIAQLVQMADELRDTRIAVTDGELTLIALNRPGLTQHMIRLHFINCKN